MVNNRGKLDYYVDNEKILSHISSLEEKDGSIEIAARLRNTNDEADIESIKTTPTAAEAGAVQRVLNLARKVGLQPRSKSSRSGSLPSLLVNPACGCDKHRIWAERRVLAQKPYNRTVCFDTLVTTNHYSHQGAAHALYR